MITSLVTKMGTRASCSRVLSSLTQPASGLSGRLSSPAGRYLFVGAAITLGCCLVASSAALAAGLGKPKGGTVIAGVAIDVTVGSANVTSGDTFSVPVTFNMGSVVLGGYDITITFDPSVLQFTGVLTNGVSDFSTPPAASQIDSTIPGRVRYLHVSSTGSDTSPTGIVVPSRVQFMAIGTNGTSSVLGAEEFLASDPAGNELFAGQITPGLVTVGSDERPPMISCPAAITNEASAEVCSASVSFNVTATGNPVPTIQCLTDGNPITSPHTFAVGTHTVTCTATSTAGSDTCSFTVTVLDTQRPTVSCPGNISVPAAAGACSSNVTYSASASDNCSASIECSPASGTSFPVGTTTVTCTATDGAGLTDACSFTVTVTDTQVPSVTCPGNISVPAATGACSSNVSYTASASDNCGPLEPNCNPVSGSSFAVGTTTVTCTATDGAGLTGCHLPGEHHHECSECRDGSARWLHHTDADGQLSRSNRLV
jgi:hypothetical protein